MHLKTGTDCLSGNMLLPIQRPTNTKLKGMVERRMRQSIYAIASCWYTAWVNAGQPDLAHLSHKDFSSEELAEF